MINLSFSEKSDTIYERKTKQRINIIRKTNLMQLLSKNPKLSIYNFKEANQNSDIEYSPINQLTEYNHSIALRNRQFLNIILGVFSIVVFVNFLMALIYSLAHNTKNMDYFIVIAFLFGFVSSNNIVIYFILEKKIYTKKYTNNNWLKSQNIIGVYYCLLTTILNVILMVWVDLNPWFINSKMGHLWSFIQYPMIFFCFLKLIQGLFTKLLILFICQSIFYIYMLFDDENLRFYDYISLYSYSILYFIIFALIVFLQESDLKENLEIFINFKKMINDWKRIANNFPHCFALFDCISEELVYSNNYGLNIFKIGVTTPNQTSLESLSVFVGKLQKIKVTSEKVNFLGDSIKSQEKIRNVLDVGSLQEILRNLKENSQLIPEQQTFIYSTLQKINLDYNMIDSSETSERKFTVKIKIISFENKPSFLLIFEDTTYQEMVSFLKETGDFKSQLLSSFSHELRTPLNGAIPLLESIRQNDQNLILNENYYLETAINSLKILQNVLNDIVDYAQMNAGQLQLNCEEINIKELINETINIVMGLAKEKFIELNICFENQLPDKFVTDSNRLKQILLNLLRNSIKFSLTKGKVFLKVKYNDLFKVIEFFLIDEGVGISEVQLIELRTLLENIKTRQIMLTSGQNGNLGLLITQSLVLILGPSTSKNSLEIFSDGLSLGTTVRFVIENKGFFRLADGESVSILNLRDEIKKNKICRTTSMSPRNSSFLRRAITWVRTDTVECSFEKTDCGENVFLPSIKEFKINENTLSTINKDKEDVDYCCEPILIVDDDPFNLLSAEVIIKKIGFKVKKAFNGKDAIEIIKENNKNKCSKKCKGIKLILMDYSMPIMNGVEATMILVEMMKNKEINNVAIVACTAFGAKEDINNCFEAGMVDYIQKPINIKVLNGIFTKFL